MRGKFAGTAIAIVLMACSAAGQSTFGTIVGVVHDKTQAVVPGRQFRYEAWTTTALAQPRPIRADHLSL